MKTLDVPLELSLEVPLDVGRVANPMLVPGVPVSYNGFVQHVRDPQVQENADQIVSGTTNKPFWQRWIESDADLVSQFGGVLDQAKAQRIADITCDELGLPHVTVKFMTSDSGLTSDGFQRVGHYENGQAQLWEDGRTIPVLLHEIVHHMLTLSPEGEPDERHGQHFNGAYRKVANAYLQAVDSIVCLSLDVPIELGDVAGHAFHGNQWTEGISRLDTAYAKMQQARADLDAMIVAKASPEEKAPLCDAWQKAQEEYSAMRRDEANRPPPPLPSIGKLTGPDDGSRFDELRRALPPRHTDPHGLNALNKNHQSVGTRDVGPVDIKGWRVGSRDDKYGRGVFYASDEQGAKAYASLHPGEEVKADDLHLTNVLLARHQDDVSTKFFGKPYSEMMDDLARRNKSEVVGGQKFDVKLAREAKKRGYDAIIYTAPAPPASGEIAVLAGKKCAAKLNLDVPLELALVTFDDIKDGGRNRVQNDLAQAAADTDVNATNDQKQSGNYKKGRVTIAGLGITIENPHMSERSGIGANGPWSTTMAGGHYGYIHKIDGDWAPRSEADGDHVDIFVSPDIGNGPETGTVYVIDQTKVGSPGDFDECKVMFGYPDADAAVKAYFDSYSPGWANVADMVQIPLDQFKDWVRSGQTASPAGLYKDGTTVTLSQDGDEDDDDEDDEDDDWIVETNVLGGHNYRKPDGRTASTRRNVFGGETQVGDGDFETRPGVDGQIHVTGKLKFSLDVPLELGVSFKTFSPTREKLPLDNWEYNHPLCEKHNYRHSRRGMGCPYCRDDGSQPWCSACGEGIALSDVTQDEPHGHDVHKACAGKPLDALAKLRPLYDYEKPKKSRLDKLKERTGMTDSVLDALVKGPAKTEPVPHGMVNMFSRGDLEFLLSRHKKKEPVSMTEADATLRERAILHSLGTRVQAARREGWNRQQIYTEVAKALASAVSYRLTPVEQEALRSLDVDDVGILASLQMYCDIVKELTDRAWDCTVDQHGTTTLDNSRIKSLAGIQNLSGNAEPVLQLSDQILSSIRGPWHHSMQSLASKLCELLSGHGAATERAHDARTERQRRELLQVECSLGDRSTAILEPRQQPATDVSRANKSFGRVVQYSEPGLGSGMASLENRVDSGRRLHDSKGWSPEGKQNVDLSGGDSQHSGLVSTTGCQVDKPKQTIGNGVVGRTHAVDTSSGVSCSLDLQSSVAEPVVNFKCPKCGYGDDVPKSQVPATCPKCEADLGGAVSVFRGDAFALSGDVIDAFRKIFNAYLEDKPMTLDIPIELHQATGKVDDVIAIDLDSTLVKKQDPFIPLGFGDPIPERWDEVRRAIAAGKNVVIFTARIANDPDGAIKEAIEDLCMEELGQVLPVTNIKTPNMVKFVDDRAEPVVPDGTDMPSLAASLDVPLELASGPGGDQGSLVLGDTPGHEFHGNQWTGGGGGAQGVGNKAAGPHPAFANFKQPMRKLLRWCGKEGMNLQQAKSAIKRAGLKMPPDPTIRAELPIGGRGMTRGGRNPEMPALTPAQKEVLRGRAGATDPGVPARQAAAAAVFKNNQGAGTARRPAPAAAPAAAPASPTYADHKDRADRADEVAKAVRDRIQAGERGKEVYQDRAAACLTAAKIHKEAAEAARAAGDRVAGVNHDNAAQEHEMKAAKYNGKIGDPKDKVDPDGLRVNNAVKAIDDARAEEKNRPPATPVSVSPDALKREAELSTTPAVKAGEVPDGGGVQDDHVSQIFLITTSDGKKHVFKPASGERGFYGCSEEPEKGKDARREVAAYNVAKVVGMTDLVPVTVMRDQPKIKTPDGRYEVSGLGSAQDFCGGCKKGGRAQNRWDSEKDAERCAAFDYVMGLADRHAGNWLIDKDGARDGKIHLIDHGWSLPDRPGTSIDSRGFIGHANSERTPIAADTKKAWAGKWDQIQNGLEKVGIGPKAIAMCKKRYDKFMAAKNYSELKLEA